MSIILKQPVITTLSKMYKKNHVFNLIGHPKHTMEAIYDISFMLYRKEIPYGITSNSYCVLDNVLAPAYYTQLRNHISNAKVILNNCGLINCKDTWNIKSYVDTISADKWTTMNLFVYKNKTHLKYNHFSELCSNCDCDHCPVSNDLFILSVPLQEKINHIDNLLQKQKQI